MAKRKAKAGQPELAGMPERDRVGQAAKAYLDQHEQLQEAKESLDAAAGELIQAMMDAERQSVSIGGKTLTLKHVAKDAIVVRTSREK